MRQQTITVVGARPAAPWAGQALPLHPSCGFGARRALFSALLLLPALLSSVHAAEKPKVRAVTAFVRIDPANYRAQVQEALTVLRRAKAAFEQAGYEVQSIRIATQPFGEYTRGLSSAEAVAFFQDYEKLAKAAGFDASIGPAMFVPGSDPREADLLADVLSKNLLLNASLTVADENGVRWEAVRAAARIMKRLQQETPGGIANFNFAAAALARPHTPFFPAAYHDGPGRRFAVALQSANVVAEAFASAGNPSDARKNLESALGTHASVIEAVAKRVAEETKWEYMGIDLSPAPLREVSIGGAFERLGGKFGSSGTMTAAATVTAALAAIPVKHAGYSGLMVPVLEDSVLAQRWSEGTLTVDALLAYSAVCGTGLDTVPLPGDVTVEQLAHIIGDMASLAVKLHKPLSARLMPVSDKKAGDRTEFNDPFLVNATIQRLP